MGSTTIIRKVLKGTLIVPGLALRRRPGDVVILLYHRLGKGTSEIALSQSLFEEHLRYLRDQKEVRTLDDALDGSSGGIVVTFDDGYKDFHEEALPLLEQHEIPTVLYVATGLVSNPSVPDGLTWSQLRDAVSTGLVTVGAHTHTHCDLSTADADTATEEMRRSKETIEDQLGVACRHFSYPWARGSVSADRIARRLFKTAALTAWRTNRRGQIDLHRLGRTPVLKSDGRWLFRARTRGLLDAESIAYRVLRRGPWRRTRSGGARRSPGGSTGER